VTLTLTGKQIKDMLEQQWLDPKRPRILQVRKVSATPGTTQAGRRAHLADGWRSMARRSIPPGTIAVTVTISSAVGRRTALPIPDAKEPPRRIGVYDIDAFEQLFPGQTMSAPPRRGQPHARIN
jgi:5'-nucleotidase